MSRVPLFPLPVVLFPGMRMPLHIFEPRYREMLRDCLAADRQFGLVFRANDTDALTVGNVGCRAHIEDVETLADGRSNIVVRGSERFAIVALREVSTPYIVAEVAPFADQLEPIAQLTALSLRLNELFIEAASAAQALTDENRTTPVLTDDPGQIAFDAAAAINLENDQRQRLLASSSPSGRMRELIAVLDTALPELRQRASTHTRARSNGHGAQHA